MMLDTGIIDTMPPMHCTTGVAQCQITEHTGTITGRR